MTSIYVIAGEASGDLLGANLLAALKTHSTSALRIHGVGGEQMQSHGLNSLFPMEELSLLGFLEIIPHIPKLLKRIDQTADDIIAKNPDIVVTIDAPAFTRRVVKNLRKKTGERFKIVHYVAPSVWAYKPKRAEKMAALFDHLLCLLPFEPPYFEKLGLPATAIGHTIVERDAPAHTQAILAQYNIPDNVPIIGMVPGSRSSELKRHLPILQEACALLQQRLPNAHIIMPSTARFAERLQNETATWALPCHIVADKHDKWHIMGACHAALVKSGTVSLEWARALVPSVIFYKVNPLSAWLLRRMIKVDYVNLINLLENTPALPELLQEDCTAEKMADEVIKLVNNADAAKAQQAHMQSALNQLGLGHKKSPSEQAAQTILSLIN